MSTVTRPDIYTLLSELEPITVGHKRAALGFIKLHPDVVGLDVDEKLTLAEAEEELKDYVKETGQNFVTVVTALSTRWAGNQKINWRMDLY